MKNIWVISDTHFNHANYTPVNIEDLAAIAKKL